MTEMTQPSGTKATLEAAGVKDYIQELLKAGALNVVVKQTPVGEVKELVFDNTKMASVTTTAPAALDTEAKIKNIKQIH